MVVKLLLFIAGVCALTSGCRLTENLARTTVIEPTHYSDHWEKHSAKKRYRKRARQLLAETPREHDSAQLEADYSSGFQDGYADYLISGGTGQPPPIPPHRYWRKRYQTPNGRMAVQQWFKGFRDGSQTAIDTGYRELVIVPSSLQAAIVAFSDFDMESYMNESTPPIDPEYEPINPAEPP